MRSGLTAIVATTLAAAPAAADHQSLHATLSGDVSTTDNVFATPSRQAEGDIFTTIRPGGLWGYDAPRFTNDLAVEAELIEFLAHSDAPSISLRGSERAVVTTSRHTNLIAVAEGSNGVLSALSSRSSPNVTGVVLTPTGRIDVISGDANEQFSWSSGRELTLSETAFIRGSRSDDNADDLVAGAIPTIIKDFEYGGSLGIEKSFRRGDAFNLDAGASVLRLERDADPNAVLGPRLDHQIDPRARAQWRHDWNKRWSHVLNVGAVYVHPYGKDPDNPNAMRKDATFPTFGAGVAYTEVFGRAELLVGRDLTPNLLIDQNTVNESATLQLAMPLPILPNDNLRAPKVALLGSLGVSRTRLVDSDTNDVSSSFYLGRLDVGIGYKPRPGFTYGVRYEFIYQTGDDKAVMSIPGFYRNTISFTFTIRYPDRIAGDEAQKRSKSSAVRADGSDLVPLGVDPTPPRNGAGGEGEDGGGADQPQQQDEGGE